MTTLSKPRYFRSAGMVLLAGALVAAVGQVEAPDVEAASAELAVVQEPAESAPQEALVDAARVTTPFSSAKQTTYRQEPAATGQIRGVVTDVATAQPLADAKVFIVDGTIASVSTSAGAYALTDVPAGTHLLRVERVGYAAESRAVALTDGAVLETNFALTATSTRTRLREQGNTITQSPPNFARISGRATEAASGAPLSEVQVYLVGANIGAITRQNGAYIILNVPPGVYTMRAERIGLGMVSREITVGEGAEIEANFQLSPTQLSLDEIVVTGTAGTARRREVGPPDASGAVVEPEPIGRLREELNRQTPPLIYIDGVRIRPEPGTDPLAALKPENIDRVEIIKGPATAIFGPEGVNGVIQIFLKKP